MNGTGLPCIGLAENLSHFRTPAQFFAGWGAFQRKSPTGGAANGIPLKMLISPLLYPETTPFSVLISDNCPDDFKGHKTIATNSNNKRLFFEFFMFYILQITITKIYLSVKND
jgi:hypothetical protein